MESEESPVMETAAANTTPAADNTTPAAGATVETATENPAEIVTDNPAEALNNANVGEVQTVAEGENLPTVEVVSEEAELAGEGKAEEELPCNSEGNLSLENSMDNEGSEMVMSQAKDRSEFYLPETLRPPQSVADLGRECLALHHVFGNDNSKRGNLHIIEDDVVVYATSSSVIFENLVSSSKRYLLGVDEGGVGCVAVHPSRNYLAVGCKGFQSKIYIYTYPELKIIKRLSGGAERGYSCLNFSAAGDQLASVSTSPDFMLTIWDWEEERMGLHSKAFGQDIYKVAFSKDDSRRLTTSGTGHIRFWKMAATFTGLKLQGSIGKFGKIDLSDIEAFVELPDGKVVSGTETGALLLWEGNFIKCQFIQHGGSACHSGTITYLGLDRKEQCVISASTDGYIRWWDFNTMDSAEVDSDHSMNFELLPIAEYYVGGTDKSGVQTMVDSGYVGTFRYFVFQDTKGRLQCYKFNLSDGSEGNIIKLCDSVIKVNELITTKQEGIREIIDTTVSNDFHWGGITGMDTCPVDHLAATCSTDGTVRCVDYVKRKVIASKSFVSGATSLRWLPSSLHKAGKYMAVGYADGVVRILSLSQGSDGSYTFVRRMAFKPHNAAITDLSFNENGTVLATSGKDGIIFFMDCFDPDSRDGQWKPLRFVTFSTMGSTGKASITCEKISWSPSGLGILCSCNDGILREVNVKEIINNTEQLKAEETFNFELFLPINEISTKIPNNLQSSRESATNILGSIEEKENKEESASPAKPTQKDENSIQLVPLKTTSAIYSSGRSTPSLLLSGVSGQKAFLFESAIGEEIPLKELPLGLYSSDGKDYLKTPTTSVFRYSLSKNYLAVGAADGSVILKPSVFLETFTRNVGHNGSTGGVSAVACSFDDCYLLSAGADGCLVIYRVRQDIVNESSPGLFKDLDAGVFGSELTKSMPKESQPEPSYLSVVSTDQALPEEAAFKARFAALPAAVLAKPLPSEADEKDDVLPGQYSIQDNQLKLEQDAKQVAADDLKNRVRASVRTLQMDYEKILEENNRIPELARISAEEIMIDKEYFDLLEAEGVAMVEEVHRECEYESEKSERLLAKITERLTEGLVVEEMTLSAFNVNRNGAPSFVKSLRTKALNENLSVILEEVHRIVRETELKDAQIRTNETAQKKALEAVDEMKIRLNKDDDAPRVDIFASAAVVKDGEGNTSDSSVAVRRVRRKERKDRLTRHLAKKPDENEDDIRDVNAIKIAERTIGDFKLKCAEDYEVPEEQRINVTKKLRQMAMLEASIHTIRLQFNQRFLALRNLKKEIIYSIRRDNKRIKEIDTALKQQDLSKLLWQPEFDPTEFPDDDDEIIESELKEYETLKNNAKNWKDVKPSSRSVVTGTKTDITRNPVNGTYHVSVQKPYDELTNKLENFLSDEKLIDYTPPRSEGPRYFEESKLILSSYVRDKATRDVSEFLELENVVPILALTKEAMTGRSQQSVLSTSQEFILEEKRKTLQFEREMILKKLYENVKAFREAIDDLRVDRHSAVADIKLAEITLLIQFQEYKLLQTFEARDDALYHKQIRCKGEETEIKSNSNDNKVKLEAKQEEIQHWNEKLKQILSDFRSVVPDSHPYVEPLTKIFKKKIKRNKGNDRDDDDEDYEESDNDDDEDDEDDEEVEDICPPGCDPSIFERVIELREKKLDTDEVSAEIQRGIEELKKTIDRLKQREKQIIKDAQQTELEVQQFQLQKQAALNLINVVVPLKLGQIFMFESSGKLTGPTDKLLLPSEDPLESAEFPTAENVLHDLESRRLVSIMDLKSHAVFTNKNLVNLKCRIDELHNEIDEAKEHFKHLHKQRGVLTKEKEGRMSDIELWSARCNELQLLKFGRVMDLDELEASSDRTKELEAEALLKDDEASYKAKAKKLIKESSAIQEQLAEVTNRNTTLLSEVAALTEKRQNITRDLNSTTKVSAQTSKVDNLREMEENRRIKAYVELQAKELESLRIELNMLKRKEAPALMVPPAPAIFSNESSRSPNGSQTNGVVFPPIASAQK